MFFFFIWWCSVFVFVCMCFWSLYKYIYVYIYICFLFSYLFIYFLKFIGKYLFFWSFQVFSGFYVFVRQLCWCDGMWKINVWRCTMHLKIRGHFSWNKSWFFPNTKRNNLVFQTAISLLLFLLWWLPSLSSRYLLKTLCLVDHVSWFHGPGEAELRQAQMELMKVRCFFFWEEVSVTLVTWVADNPYMTHLIIPSQKLP